MPKKRKYLMVFAVIIALLVTGGGVYAAINRHVALDGSLFIGDLGGAVVWKGAEAYYGSGKDAVDKLPAVRGGQNICAFSTPVISADKQSMTIALNIYYEEDRIVDGSTITVYLSLQNVSNRYAEISAPVPPNEWAAYTRNYDGWTITYPFEDYTTPQLLAPRTEETFSFTVTCDDLEQAFDSNPYESLTLHLDYIMKDEGFST